VGRSGRRSRARHMSILSLNTQLQGSPTAAVLPSLVFYDERFLPVNVQLAPAALSLLATSAWGTSDFLGGYAARRANVYLLTTITHISGTALMLTLALVSRAPFPAKSSSGWAVAAGFLAGIALAVFYGALSLGNMGLVAPVVAVLGAAIPTAVDMFMEGRPGTVRMVGFLLASIGIWLVSRTEGSAGRPAGLSLAVLAGIGFAGYFLSIKQAGGGSVFWIAAISRMTSFLSTGAVVLAARQFHPMNAAGVRWGVVTGMLDISGSAFFILASQSGRLDAAVVISSLYPAITVLLAGVFLKEQFSRWKLVGLLAALLAVPLIAW
jgi:drug/metabolite transporter (DMT)-like permease